MGWTEEQTGELKALVDLLGPKWTEVGKRLRRTAYTCRAAYKRLLDKSTDPEAVMPRWSDRRKSLSENLYKERIRRLFTCFVMLRVAYSSYAIYHQTNQETSLGENKYLTLLPVSAQRQERRRVGRVGEKF